MLFPTNFLKHASIRYDANSTKIKCIIRRKWISEGENIFSFLESIQGLRFPFKLD